MEKTKQLEENIKRLEVGLNADLAHLADLREDLRLKEINVAKLETKMAKIRASILEIQLKIKGAEEKLASLKRK